MRLHYKGKFDLNPDSLPCLPHEPNAVKFKEAEDTAVLAVLATKISVGILVFCLALLVFRCDWKSLWYIFPGFLISIMCAFPHELLHAVCFKEDVYLYTNRKQGMLFVVGPERMSKGRFVFMSLLPNLVFGLLPFILGLAANYPILGCMGAISLSMGAGDFYNVYNALTQIPKGAKTYLHKFNSYWYMP